MCLLSVLEKEEYSWIKKSHKFENFNNESIEDFQICPKYTNNIDEYLNVIDFWDVYYLPIEFYILLELTRPYEQLKILHDKTKNEFHMTLFCLAVFPENNIYTKMARVAAISNHLDLLIYMKTVKNYEFVEQLSIDAASQGNIECLIFLNENGCQWNENTMTSAAANNQLECIKFLYKKNCSWNNDTTGNAVQNGCPWNHGSCIVASRTGNLECLKYLHENGCPLSIYVTAGAAQNGHFECLKYLHENGCPWDIHTTHWSLKNNHIECFNYAFLNGCPQNCMIFK